MNNKQLVDDIKNGKLQLHELNYNQVEDIVFHQLTSSLREKSSYPIEITRNRRGEIDIVIEIYTDNLSLHPIGNFNPKTVIFIECKHYKRPLEFDVVAKAFCVAIKELPDQLIIVSNSQISPQARRYAQYFFNTDNSEGYFKKTLFSIKQLYEIIGLKDQNKVKYNTEIFVDSGNNEFTNQQWNLIESDIFSNRIIASESISDSKSCINLINGYEYIITFAIPVKNSDHLWSLNIIHNGKVLEKISPFSKEDLLNNKVLLSFNVSQFQADKFNQINTLKFEIEHTYSSNNSLFLIPVIFECRSNNNILPNLRYTFELNKCIEFAEKSNTPIGLVSGEAGIGKSHLCTEICRHLKNEYDYNCQSISFSNNSTEGSFIKMLWSLVLPELNHEEISNDTDVQMVFKTYFKKIIYDFEEGISDEIFDKIFQGNISDSDLEIIIYLIARIIVENPTPQTIWFRNCNLLSPKIIKNMEFLINSLIDLNWGKCKILLEYRQDDMEINPDWDSFLYYLQKNYFSLIQNIHVESISMKELSLSLSKMFAGDIHLELTNILMKKTGGNPFFISQILMFAIDNKWIKTTQNNKYKYQVIDINALYQKFELLPSSINKILSIRLRTILNDFENSKASLASLEQYLTASAFLGYQIDENRIFQAFGINKNELEEIRFFLINKKILSANLSDSSANFVHELMLTAAKVFMSQIKNFRSNMLLLEKQMSKTVINDALIGGDINFALHRVKESFSWYELGLQLSKSKELYENQIVCLKGCKAILELDNHVSVDNYRKIVAVGLRLGWCEMQSGSQVNALKVVSELRNKLNKLPYGIKTMGDEHSLWLYESAHLESVMLVKLMKPNRFLIVIKTALHFSMINKQLRATLTRLLLMSCICNFPNLAINVAKKCFLYLDMDNYDSTVSLLSDVGHIFLLSNPKLVKKIWNYQTNKISELRQRSHSNIDTLVLSIYLGENLPNTDELEEFITQLQILGIENQMTRLIHCQGIIAYNNGNHIKALNHFLKALRKSQLFNQVYWQWKSHNNLGVLYYLEDKIELAESHFISAYTLLEEVLELSINEKESYKSEVKTILNSIDDDQSILNDSMDIDYLNVETDICAVYFVLLSNINNLSQLPEFSGFSKLSFIAEHKCLLLPENSLLICKNKKGKNLYFALE